MVERALPGTIGVEDPDAADRVQCRLRAGPRDRRGRRLPASTSGTFMTVELAQRA